MDEKIDFLNRLSMALKIIFSGDYAQSVLKLNQEAAPAAELKSADADSALQLLALLQKEGRLIDFINEDVNSFADDQVAAAARVVHQGVKKSLAEHVIFVPVCEQNEGDGLELQADFDKHAYRLTGNISGDAPYRGTLIHKGWKADSISLPQIVDGTDLNIIAAAEVEL